jgi:hypothetical protein
MPTQSTIYSNCNPHWLKLFEEAGHPAKVMCVALDYAKAHHTALFCNGVGDLLKGCFAFENTTAGANQLLNEVRACAKQRKIQAEHIFFGGEDCPSYAENFLRRVREDKFVVVRVNAWEAKRQRDNFQPPVIPDLLGIARCCLNRRAESLQDLPRLQQSADCYTRSRQARALTHPHFQSHPRYVDRLFPGFLKIEKSGLDPFCKASLDLMEERFSPEQLSRRPRQALTEWLGRRGVNQPEEVAGKLKQLAKEALGPAAEQTVMLQRTLAKLIKLYRGLEESIAMLDREVAHWLARTPGALLTSIGGFGITLAAC